MTVKLYVGNLSYDTTEDSLRSLFDQRGEVKTCELVLDRFTGRSRGFAFVEMSSREEADQAIEQFNDYEFEGRKLVVNEARPREKQVGGFGGRPSGGDSYGGGRKSGKGSRRGARSAKRDKKAFW